MNKNIKLALYLLFMFAYGFAAFFFDVYVRVNYPDSLDTFHVIVWVIAMSCFGLMIYVLVDD